jgi:hypothetical protein
MTNAKPMATSSVFNMAVPSLREEWTDPPRQVLTGTSDSSHRQKTWAKRELTGKVRIPYRPLIW